MTLSASLCQAFSLFAPLRPGSVGRIAAAVSIFVLAMCLVAGGAEAAPRPGLDDRESNPTCVAGDRPTSQTNATGQQAFSGIGLNRKPVIGMVQPPSSSAWWLIAERGGLIHAVDNNPATQIKTLALDISDRLQFTVRDGGTHSQQWGITAIAFHPDFPTKGFLYVSYNAADQDGDVTSTVSRFTVGSDGRSFDPNSEKVILTLPQITAYHHVGPIAFGLDGYLYIGAGDGGLPYRDRAQDTSNLYGKLLRIDVDGGDPYGIPSDNPFAPGTPGAGQGEPEIFAWGLRNPWRLTVDRETGDIWEGDVGQNFWEEVNKIENGGNYGWPILEGNNCHHLLPNCFADGLVDPSFLPPVHEMPHSVGRAIIGGYMYRGSAMPSLRGSYVFGDFEQRALWALVPAPGNTYVRRTLLELPFANSVHTFAEDNDGELYVASSIRGSMYKIVPAGGGGVQGTIASKLSETGCFDAADPTRTLPALIPYSLNAPLWSDDADKQRFMALPDGGKVTITPSGDMQFPVGTVFVKSFLYADKFIETRLFMRHTDGGWAGYTYEWNDAQTEAFLLGADGRPDGKPEVIDGHDGEPVNWTYPSRAQCVQCHTEAAGSVLGPEVGQLNGEFTYPSTGFRANQLMTWDHLDLFVGGLPAPVADLPAFARPKDAAQSMIRKARSYLHSNCSSCHRPNGGAQANIDFRFAGAIAQVGVCNEEPTQGDLGVPGAKLLTPELPELSIVSLRPKALDGDRMPPLATAIVDPLGTDMIHRWIRREDVCDVVPDTDGDGTEDNADNCVTIVNVDQRDSDHDGWGDRCDGDFNNDGRVTNADLRLLEPSLGIELGQPKFRRAHDLNGDYAIDAHDYALFKQFHGKPMPSSCCN
jgi:uncharacterized repeat protein (TIGR03806 family)